MIHLLYIQLYIIIKIAKIPRLFQNWKTLNRHEISNSQSYLYARTEEEMGHTVILEYFNIKE